MMRQAFGLGFSLCCGLLLAPAARLAAQQDSHAARPDSAGHVTSWQFAEPGFPRALLALTAGGGSMQFDCIRCPEWRGSSAPIFEATAGVQVSRAISVLLSAGAGFSSGKIATNVAWKTVAARIHPLGGLYVQPGIGYVNGTMTRTRMLPCDDLECLAVAVLSLGLAVPTKTDTLAATQSGLLELSAGYDLHIRGGVSLTPRCGSCSARRASMVSRSACKRSSGTEV